MDINLDDLYFPTEEEIKESISLTSNEESEEPYYLPTVEEAEQAEIIFSFGENKEENYESDENPYLPTKEEKEQSQTIFSFGDCLENSLIPLRKESICQEEYKESIVECPPDAICLSDCMEMLPNGIIECITPQIGSIELELKTNRNSIIILTSTKDADKYCCDEYFVVGNTYCGDNLSIEEQIKVYISKISNIKILLYCQDLPTLFSILGTCCDYFLLIEDIDILLYESSYKETVEEIMDYYMMFHSNNRCLFTSDSTIFNTTQLANEQRTIIQWNNHSQRNLQVYESVNIIGCLVKMLQKIPSHENILIVYTSVQQAKQVILNLPEKMQEECGIICLPHNKRAASDYYMTQEENTLITSKRIAFWSINHLFPKFIGKYHLITVSDSTKGSTILSLKTILQIYQMIENPMQNILSDNIIYNKTQYYTAWEKDYKILSQRAYKIIQLTDAADVLSTDDTTLGNIFGLAKTVIKEKAKGKITGRFAPFHLTRKDIDGKIQFSNMNFAVMKLRTNLIYQFYSNHGSLSEKLKEIYNTLYYHGNDMETDITEKQKEIEKEEKRLQKKYKQDDRISCLEEIEKIYDTGKLSIHLLNKRSKYGNSTQRKTYKEIALLYEYIDTKELITLMKELKSDNSIAFKNLNNAIIFWALADDHPFKEAIKQAFPIDAKFSNREIVDLLLPIIQYHLHKDWTNKPRKAISFFKSLVNTIRPRTYYITLQDHRFIGHKDRIPKNDNNLLKDFLC